MSGLISDSDARKQLVAIGHDILALMAEGSPVVSAALLPVMQAIIAAGELMSGKPLRKMPPLRRELGPIAQRPVSRLMTRQAKVKRTKAAKAKRAAAKAPVGPRPQAYVERVTTRIETEARGRAAARDTLTMADVDRGQQVLRNQFTEVRANAACDRVERATKEMSENAAAQASAMPTSSGDVALAEAHGVRVLPTTIEFNGQVTQPFVSPRYSRLAAALLRAYPAPVDRGFLRSNVRGCNGEADLDSAARLLSRAVEPLGMSIKVQPADIGLVLPA